MVVAPGLQRVCPREATPVARAGRNRALARAARRAVDQQRLTAGKQPDIGCGTGLLTAHVADLVGAVL
jgi:hypothetical protein